MGPKDLLGGGTRVPPMDAGETDLVRELATGDAVVLCPSYGESADR